MEETKKVLVQIDDSELNKQVIELTNKLKEANSLAEEITSKLSNLEIGFKN